MDSPKAEVNPTSFRIPVNGWGDKKFKLKNKFGFLSEIDLQFRHGEEATLVARLASRLNKTEAEVERLINAL